MMTNSTVILPINRITKNKAQKHKTQKYDKLKSTELNTKTQ